MLTLNIVQYQFLIAEYSIFIKALKLLFLCDIKVTDGLLWKKNTTFLWTLKSNTLLNDVAIFYL